MSARIWDLLADATFPRWLWRGPQWWRALNSWWLARWGWAFLYTDPWRPGREGKAWREEATTPFDMPQMEEYDPGVDWLGRVVRKGDE